MANDQIKGPLDLSNKPKGPAASTAAERDATIERLERAVADERQHAAMLRKTAQDLRFKAGILETSYAKQLEDARLRSETAERELADQQAQLAALESAHEEAMRLLAEARRELGRAPASGGQLRKTLAPADDMRMNSIAQDDAESQVQEGSLTINRLMKDSSWADERQPVGHEKEHLDEHVRADQEPTPEELIAPDLVFTVTGSDS